MKRLPGVERATAVSALPMSPLGVQFDLPFTVDGLAATSPSERPRARYRAVMPEYFQTMGIALKKGRVFDAFDGREGGPKVAIVNESVVRRYFGAVDPIDKLVRMPMAGDLHIVGVVADIRHDGLQASAEAEVFVPYDQFPLSQMQVVVVDRARCRDDRQGRQGATGRNRSVAADRQGVDDRGARVGVDRAAALQHDAAGGPRAVRGAARRGGRLRGRHLLGHAPHRGDRRAHGARRRRGAHVPARRRAAR